MEVTLFSTNAIDPKVWGTRLSAFGTPIVHRSFDELATYTQSISDPKPSRILIIDQCIATESAIITAIGLIRVDLPVVIGSSLSVSFAVQLAHSGAFVFIEDADSDRSLERLLNCWRNRDHLWREYAQLASLFGSLTEKERSVLQLALQGSTSKAIGIGLNLSTRTVESLRNRIYRKLHSASFTNLHERSTKSRAI